jgi:hypothetical protein
MPSIIDDDKDKTEEEDTIQDKRRKQRQKGITKKEFHSVLDKASQPIDDKSKREK